MLTHLEIASFRGIREGSVANLRPLTFLTGPNGSGKSALLDALFVGGHADPAAAVGELGAQLSTSGGPRYLTYGASAEPSRLKARSTQAARAVAVAVREARGETPARADVQVRTADVTAAGTVDLGAKIGAVAWKSEPPVLWETASRARAHAALSVAWSAATLAGRTTQILERVRRIAPTIDDLQLVVDTDGEARLYAISSGRALPVAVCGSGLAAFVAWSVAAFAAPAGLVLFDEPFPDAHPSVLLEAARVLWDLVGDGRQVVVATQRLELVDAALALASRTQGEQIGLRRLGLSEDGALFAGAVDGEELSFARSPMEADLR
jgi:predicted ATPase